VNITNFNAFKKRGGLWFVGSSILAKFSGLLITVLLAKNLDVETFGQMTQYIAFSAILIPLLSLSAQDTYLYFASKNDCSLGKKASLLKSFSIQILLGTVLAFFIAVTISYFYTDFSNKLFVFILYSALFALSNLCIAYFRVVGVNRMYSILFTLQNLTLLIIVCLFLLFKFDVIYAWPLSSLFFISYIFMRVFSPRLKNKFQDSKAVLPNKSYVVTQL